MRTLLWPVLALYIASCGRIDYDPSAVTDGGAAIDARPDATLITPVDAAPDAFNGDPDTLWWDRAWSHRVRLTIDTNDLGEDLFNIPVAVYLDATRIDAAKVRADGADVRFVGPDNKTVLEHEIDTWPELELSVVGDAAVIWVMVPELKAAAGKSHFWLYYGNAVAQPAQRPEKVWSSGYVGVWHLDQPADPRLDVTGNGNALSARGSIESIAGRLGDGVVLSSKIDGLPLLREVIDPGANDTSGLTVEAWILPASSEEIMVIAAKSDYDGGRSFELYRLADETIELALSFDCSNAVTAHSPSRTGVDRWHHVAGTFDGDVMRIYHNGVLTAEEPVNLSAGYTPCANDAPFTLGAIDDGKLPFDGVMDELRLSGHAHSGEWIRVQNRATNDDLITYGAQEAQF